MGSCRKWLSGERMIKWWGEDDGRELEGEAAGKGDGMSVQERRYEVRTGACRATVWYVSLWDLNAYALCERHNLRALYIPVHVNTHFSFVLYLTIYTHMDTQHYQDMGWTYSCMCTWPPAYLRIQRTSCLSLQMLKHTCPHTHTLSIFISTQMIFRQDLTWQFMAWVHLHTCAVYCKFFPLLFEFYFFPLYG